MRIINYGPDNVTNLPVSGGGSALVAGALLKPGPTPATNNGTLVLASGNSTRFTRRGRHPAGSARDGRRHACRRNRLQNAPGAA
jgi:hypothetical protein